MQITTEITSSKIASDNPIHQRLLYAYEACKSYLFGDVLEVGCGEGRGLETIEKYCKSYTALDKNTALLETLSKKYPSFSFINTHFPPFNDLKDNSFDTIICFQVIEHIQDDVFFLKEMARVLKPGGKAIISTPNINLTLSRNPWHTREYTPEQLQKLLSKDFKTILVAGITGNKKVIDYYEINKKSVQKIMRWDIFNLQYVLPASILQIPYDFLNRMNRNKMMGQNQSLVSEISTQDYSVSKEMKVCFDLFYIATK
ncbi:MAG: class I SAM-dependent methyltransferase [Cytophagales bacterium]|nr:MAG: class I SAM-dependent methyltransferase [Cytophagales bacterium]